MTTSLRSLLVGLGVLLVVGSCKGKQRTELVVEVGTNLAVPVELDKIDLAITSNGTTQHTPYSLVSDYEIPVLVGIVEASDGAGTVEIVATGYLNAAPIVRETAVLGFVEGKSMLLKLFLAAECRGDPCKDPTTTCTKGGTCRDKTRTPSELTPYVPGNSSPLADSAVPASTGGTAGRPDSGPDKAAPTGGGGSGGGGTSGRDGAGAAPDLQADSPLGGTDGGPDGFSGAGGKGAGGTGRGGTIGMGGITGTGGSTITSGSAGTGGTMGTGGAPSVGGARTGGTTATGGIAGTGGLMGTGGTTTASLTLITSASGAYWKTAMWTEATSGNATVTVNDTLTAQTWEGFGGAFNELGWSYLTSSDMQTQALTLLFSATDGANFTWGRIPMGASDYAMSRYTLDDTGTDVTPNSDESNRPAADTSLSNFSIDRDGQKLIPYIKAAQAVKSDIRFWASPWTPPVWMKTGYLSVSDAERTKPALKPSYYDGGNMRSDAATLTAYAQYYTRFVQGYRNQGINIEMVSPQHDPGFDQNYPSCLWDKATYTTWIGQYLGPAMKSLDVKVMLGTLSNAGNNGRTDLDISSAVMADSTAMGYVSVVGVAWGMLDKVNGGVSFGGLPIWAFTHKCGNYPWSGATGCGDGASTSCPAYNSTQAPNNQAYGVESWYQIRNAIKRGKVTAYNAWNMVLDKLGVGIDTTRDWKQDALLVADSGGVNPTPAYYVFRHFSQYVAPGATVVGTSGGDAVAFKNPDGTFVAVMYNSGSANSNYSVAIRGNRFQFAMPAGGWATVKYKP